MNAAAISLLAFVVAAPLLSNADTNAASAPLVTATCENYPEVTCSSTNGEISADIAQLATETRDQLGPLLKLGPHWRYPVHIRVLTKDDPLAAALPDRAVAATVRGKELNLEAITSDQDSDSHEFVQRQFIKELLWEKYFPADKTFSASTPLDVAPLWLTEGLREWLNDDPEHNRAEIVRRAALGGHAPTLAEVTSWRQLSDDRLMGLWQRAFSYYLVNSMVLKPERRADFQQWLATVSGSNATSAQQLFPTEMAWQHELVAATERSRDVVYTWEETVAELASAESIVVSPSSQGSDNAHICTIDTAMAFPVDKDFATALNQKVLDLTALELRAHPSWRPTIALYRFGLGALIANKPEEARKFLAQAQQERTDEMAARTKLVDYINWFEVTHDFGGNSSDFSDYFSTAHELEKAQADPAHPNPIRASVLHVESEL